MKKKVKKVEKKVVVKKEPVLTHELRIPTADTYAYLNIQFKGTPDEAYSEYLRLIEIVKGGDGLEPKEFNAVLDELITKRSISGDPGIMTEMSIDQSAIIQAIKRSFARTK